MFSTWRKIDPFGKRVKLVGNHFPDRHRGT